MMTPFGPPSQLERRLGDYVEAYGSDFETSRGVLETSGAVLEASGGVFERSLRRLGSVLGENLGSNFSVLVAVSYPLLNLGRLSTI